MPSGIEAPWLGQDGTGGSGREDVVTGTAT
jgi:hypothetical protein